MKPIGTRLKAVAWLVGFLMAGLLAVQACWVDANLQLQERQIDQQVRGLLSRVADDLLADELAHLARLPGFFRAGPQGLPPPSNLEISDSLEIDNRIEIAIGGPDSASLAQLPGMEIPQPGQRQPTQWYLLDGIWEGGPLPGSSGLVPFDTRINTRVLRPAGAYEIRLQRVVSRLAGHGIPVEQRLDTLLLDSLLHTYLKSAGLPGDYVFAVVRNTDQQVLAGNLASVNEEERTFKIPVYHFAPEATSGATLHLGLNGLRRQLLGQMAGLLGLTALLIGSLIWGFYYVMRVIYRQKRLDSMKNDFIDNMTHELKTPVATLHLAGEALSTLPQAGEDERLARYAEIIRQESHRLEGHLERVLRLAAYDRNGLQPDMVWVDALALAREAAQAFQFRAASQQGRLWVEAEPADGRFQLPADPDLLRSVLDNLLDNALKYTQKPPEVCIRLALEPENLRIEVRDNGIGMPPEVQRLAFDKFYRRPTANLHDVKGFGLGLTFCRQIVQAHGGSIGVASHPGMGSVFTILLPRFGQHPPPPTAMPRLETSATPEEVEL